jgi:hypothetical protein
MTHQTGKTEKTEFLGQGNQSLGVKALFHSQDWFMEYERAWD